jgi:hypothetical protein
MKCTICGRDDALIRKCELDVVRITHRAHVDCIGHSEYRHVSDYDIEESIAAHRKVRPT